MTMENKLSFSIILSLKELALRNVIISLWNQPEILVSIENYCKYSPDDFCYSKKWRESVENKVKDNMSELLLPKLVSKQMFSVVTSIGLQILKWKVFHERYLEKTDSAKFKHPCEKFGYHILEKLTWTSAGLIDYLKTAQELIRCEILDIEKRYQLACLYCLLDCIPLLWKDLPEGVKGKYYDEESNSRFEISSLASCFPYMLKEKESVLDGLIRRYPGHHQRSFNHVALAYSAGHGNKVATDFFLQRILKEESYVAGLGVSFRSFLIDLRVRKFPTEISGNVLCFFLSSMNYEQQMKVLQLYSIDVFICFLDWQWQDIFLKIANLVWGFLSSVRYEELLHKIRLYFGHNYSYRNCFQELFVSSPIGFRQKFVDYECRFGFLRKCVVEEDFETVEVILRNIDEADRVRLLCSDFTLELFYNSFLAGKEHMVEVCLREAMLSKEDLMRVFEDFLTFLKDRGEIEKSRPVWMKFLQIIDKED